MAAGYFLESRINEGDLLGIDHYMFDPLAFPGVGDVNEAIVALNNGWIRIFARFGFEREGGLPVSAVLGNGHIERGATGGGVVVNDPRASVEQLHGVDSAVRIWEGGFRHGAPGFSGVMGPGFRDRVFRAATDDLKVGGAMNEDGRLNGTEFGRVVQWAGFFPAPAVFEGEFEVDFPAGVFRAGGAEEGAIGEFDRFIFDRAEKPVGEPLGKGPGFALVGGRHHHAPPGGGAGADFEKQEERSVSGLEKHRVPAGQSFFSIGLNAIGGLAGSGPFFSGEARIPNADVGIFFSGAAEPCGNEAIGSFGDGRGMAGRKGGVLIDELGGDNGGVAGNLGGRAGDDVKQGERREKNLRGRFHIVDGMAMGVTGSGQFDNWIPGMKAYCERVAKPNCIDLPNGMIIPILYEDRSVMAIDKPAHWLLAPDEWDRTGRNLQLALNSSIGGRDYWATSRNLKYLRYVHRLDAETTGILLLAKSAGALRSYSELFETRQVEKVYWAVVAGKPTQAEWDSQAKIAPHGQVGRMKIDERIGKEAETRFRLLQTRGESALVEARPLTGRTHQIRVHLEAAGIPVRGDAIYGSRQASGSEDFPMGLRAVELSYPDPFQRRMVRISAPTGEFLKAFGFAAPGERKSGRVKSDFHRGDAAKSEAEGKPAQEEGKREKTGPAGDEPG